MNRLPLTVLVLASALLTGCAVVPAGPEVGVSAGVVVHQPAVVAYPAYPAYPVYPAYRAYPHPGYRGHRHRHFRHGHGY